jgi:CHAT domain-containing protein/tetratricopeptide (TPR) repeat protein
MSARTLVRTALLVLSLAFSIEVGQAAAKSRYLDEVQRLDQEAVSLSQAGKYPEATQAAKRAVAAAERRYGPNDQRVIGALNRLAAIYRMQGRFTEAEPVCERTVVLAERTLSPKHPDLATALDNLATVYQKRNRSADAELLFKRALAIREAVLGPTDAFVGATLSGLADLYTSQNRNAEAEPLYKRILAIFEKQLGPEHPEVASPLVALALVYKSLNRYAEAEPLFSRSLAIQEKALGPDHPDVATTLSGLASVYQKRSRFAEAEPLFKRALAIREKTRGADHPDVARALDDLADIYRILGRYAEAEPLFKRELAIGEKTPGSDLAIGSALHSLAMLSLNQGRFGDAESLFKRSLVIRERVLGPIHNDVAEALNGLASAYVLQGRFEEAEPLLKRSLAIRENVLGPEHPDVATVLYFLATGYQNQGRLAEAEPLLKRALTVKEKALGVDHADVGAVLTNLAFLYLNENRFTEVEPLLKRSLAIFERAYGPESSQVATDLNNLAALYDFQNRFSEAEPLYQRTLSIKEKTLGPNHTEVGTALNNLALLAVKQGRFADAEQLYQRVLTIKENALGPDHPDVSNALNNFAGLYFAQSDWTKAVELGRKATAVLVRRTRRGTESQALTGRRAQDTQQLSAAFFSLIKASNRLVAGSGNAEPQLPGEMFQMAQWALASEAAQSLSQMAARAAKDDAGLATLIRERQDLVLEWQKRDQFRSVAVSQPPDKRDHRAETDNAARLDAIDARIVSIDKRLAADFPDYAAFANPVPASIADVQAVLGPDEALLMFLDSAEEQPIREETCVWVVTKTESRWVRSDFGTPTLNREVAALRCGLDYEGAWVGTRCTDLLKVDYTRADRALGKPLPFDLARAHQLYQALFGQVEDLIKNKRLLIVPSGALTQLPFQVLVTEPPKTALPESLSGYRDVAWLARQNSVTVLPAVSALRALRLFAKESHASNAFVGFGDPLLDGDPAHFKDDAIAARLAREARCPGKATQQLASLMDRGGRTRAGVRSSGGLTDIAELRSWAPLPETADELCDVAQTLGADTATDLYLGVKATESEIKRLSESGALAKYRIVHFATHGAVAGELSGATEPGLVLTPPDKATEIDDGYLTASEIAGLKVDADWVILSACNTAAGGAQGAEALSGLARAFFYAGARSLLVSHWAVASDSTVKLITQAAGAFKSDPKIGRAEALRRSMLSLMTTGKGYEAHPAFWAPFVLVGEGGPAR